MSERIDKVLVELGLATTRSQAKQLIEDHFVFYDSVLVQKVSQTVELDSDRIEVRKAVQYASRGAHKIEGALHTFNISCVQKVVADVGASTGGFTDYVLNLGAKKVYAIDVGRDQLASHLRADPRVQNIEGTNIRFPLDLGEKVDLAVVDLSFISLRLTMPSIFSLVKEGGDVIALVKPQFEAGVERIGKKGIVRPEHRPAILLELYNWFCENNFIVQNACRSPIEGKSGNVEYFFLFTVGENKSDFTPSNLEQL